MRSLLLWACLGTLGCVHLPLKSTAADPVQVVAFSGTFPTAERGELRMELGVHNPHASDGQLREVAWEVWLNGRWFAAGVAQVSEVVPGHGSRRLSLVMPVSFRRTSKTAAAAPLRIGIRGQVRTEFSGIGGGPEGLVFSASLSQPLPGAPLLSSEDDEG